MERKLDRKVQFDERSRSYPIRATIPVNKPRSYTWGCNVYNDQGSEGACVGFSWSHELASRPKVVPTDNTIARSIYHRAQQLDEWPGEAYEGTSVIAGAKAVMEMKNSKGQPHLNEYRWAFGVQDLILAVGYKGPAVLGVAWWTDMFDVNENGFLIPSGEIAGGHAILCKGFKLVKKDKKQPASFENMDRDKSYFTLHNSWGQSWGINGTAKVTVNDMHKLLTEDGEACIPVKRN